MAQQHTHSELVTFAKALKAGRGPSAAARIAFPRCDGLGCYQVACVAREARKSARYARVLAELG